MYNLYDEKTLANLCRTYNLRPSKQYGQNYLVEPEVIETMLDVAGVNPEDTVVEVGPGFGVLTEALAPVVKRLVSFEIEKKLEIYWQKQQRQFPTLEVVWGNALRQTDFFKTFPIPYKVVANIPYQITSPLLRFFLEEVPSPSTLTVLVQKEVAERICAQPGDMSVLGLAVQYRAHPAYIATVPRAAFWPSPAVDSAILHLEVRPRSELLSAEDEKRVFDLIKAGFSSRRKLLLKNLLPHIGKDKKDALHRLFAEFGLLPTVRAQELSLEQWERLSRVIASPDPNRDEAISLGHRDTC